LDLYWRGFLKGEAWSKTLKKFNIEGEKGAHITMEIEVVEDNL